jgi:hypothetical protein
LYLAWLIVNSTLKCWSSSEQAFDLVGEFASASKLHEDRSHETAMSGCWSLLGDVLAEARAKAVQPKATGKFTEALLNGEPCTPSMEAYFLAF